MDLGDLVFANVIDDRVRASAGDEGPPGIYCPGIPGVALPFTVIHHWKAPTGLVTLDIRFTSPSGKEVPGTGPQVRRMLGMMDLTRLEDHMEHARFAEGGMHLATFVLDGEIASQREFEVFLQAPATSLPKEVEDGLKRSDVIWVGVEHEGRDIAAPTWFAYQQGKIYVLADQQRAAGEQFVPGIPGDDLVVITRRKGRDTSLGRFHAAVRTFSPGDPDYDRLAGVLADRRRSRNGAPQESIARWKQAGVLIAELTPGV